MSRRDETDHDCVTARPQRPVSQPSHPDSVVADGGPAYAHHRQAALALLSDCPALSHMEAGFLGHVCVSATLTEKQHDWLAKLLRRHRLPPLADGSVSVAGTE